MLYIYKCIYVYSIYYILLYMCLLANESIIIKFGRYIIYIIYIIYI